MSKLQLEDHSSHGSKEKLLVAFDGEWPIGFITKYPNTRTERHPYKAFWYTVRPVGGCRAEYEKLGTFDSKEAALNAITKKHAE